MNAKQIDAIPVGDALDEAIVETLGARKRVHIFGYRDRKKRENPVVAYLSIPDDCNQLFRKGYGRVFVDPLGQTIPKKALTKEGELLGGYYVPRSLSEVLESAWDVVELLRKRGEAAPHVREVLHGSYRLTSRELAEAICRATLRDLGRIAGWDDDPEDDNLDPDDDLAAGKTIEIAPTVDAPHSVAEAMRRAFARDALVTPTIERDPGLTITTSFDQIRATIEGGPLDVGSMAIVIRGAFVGFVGHIHDLRDLGTVAILREGTPERWKREEAAPGV